MPILTLIILACVQGAAELLPVSSSAHVIAASVLLGLDPRSPNMTFLIVMLHAGTMGAAIVYFWKRWLGLLKAGQAFLRAVAVGTLCTGLLGLLLKKVIEHALTDPGIPGEVEQLFGNLPLIAGALFAAGILILVSGRRERTPQGIQAPEHPTGARDLTASNAVAIGLVQGLCLPFRGFSRSGATISTGLLRGMSRDIAEEFSFALAVVLTPPALALEFHRLVKNTRPGELDLAPLLMPGLLGMVFSFIAGLLALKLLSAWLEKGRWAFFGVYCIIFSGVVLWLGQRG